MQDSFREQIRDTCDFGWNALMYEEYVSVRRMKGKNVKCLNFEEHNKTQK